MEKFMNMWRDGSPMPYTGSRKSKSYTPFYGHWLSDFFVFIGSIMWFGIILEGVIVGYMNDEGRSNTWLEYFLLVQACCIFVLYILFPIIQFVQKKSAIISPFLLLPIHAFQWAVIFFGMALVFKPSDYRFTAPTFFEVAFYTVGFYSITVPLSTLWAIRIYAAIYQVKSQKKKREKILKGEERMLRRVEEPRHHVTRVIL